jgi:hypothetical protein
MGRSGGGGRRPLREGKVQSKTEEGGGGLQGLHVGQEEEGLPSDGGAETPQSSLYCSFLPALQRASPGAYWLRRSRDWSPPPPLPSTGPKPAMRERLPFAFFSDFFPGRMWVWSIASGQTVWGHP